MSNFLALTPLALIIAKERRIRRRCREVVQIANRESWLIGSPHTQRATVRMQRVFHTASIAREQADRKARQHPKENV